MSPAETYHLFLNKYDSDQTLTNYSDLVICLYVLIFNCFHVHPITERQQIEINFLSACSQPGEEAPRSLRARGAPRPGSVADALSRQSNGRLNEGRTLSAPAPTPSLHGAAAGLPGASNFVQAHTATLWPLGATAPVPSGG